MLPVTIGQKEVTTLIDTGSTVSLVSDSWCPHHGRVQCQRLQVKGVGGWTTSEGFCWEGSLVAQGRRFHGKLFIVPDAVMPCPAILGRDILQRISEGVTYEPLLLQWRSEVPIQNPANTSVTDILNKTQIPKKLRKRMGPM